MHTKIIFFIILFGCLIIIGCGPQPAYAPEGTRTMVAQVVTATDTPIPPPVTSPPSTPAATVLPTEIPSTVSPTATPVPTIPTVTPPPTAEPTPKTHTIQYGDTLNKIAQRYDIEMDTLQKLNAINDPHDITLGQTLIVEGTPLDRKVIVDVSDQHLVAYEDGKPVNEFVVSTGRKGSETLLGDFYIQNHIDNAYGATWGIDMPYWMGFYWTANGLQNGFHGQPVNSDGIRMWEGYVGTPISYGCIVMADDNAQWLYEWANVGTAVTIQQ